MKKYTKMVLAGVLLSSAVLGANTSVVKAASNNPLNVDTSAITNVIQNNVIHVINELLNSDSTANKVNSQKKFSDLKDGDTISVAPIFGKKDATTFNKTLQGELNVVDDNEQMVPMKAGTPNSTTGFVDKVSYTLDGTTKNVNVRYNYAMPTVSFDGNQIMNFSSEDNADTIKTIATNPNSVTVNTTNGKDSNDNDNKTDVTGAMSDDGNSVTFTPKDSYVPTGIPATRTVNRYTTPNWSKLNTDAKTRTVTKLADLDQPSVIANDNGQVYLVKASYDKDKATDTSVDVTYTATAIDSKGNVVNDDSTGAPITYNTSNPTNVNIDSTVFYPTATFTDVKSGQVVYTNNFGKKTDEGKISAEDVQSSLPKGYTLSSPSDFSYSADSYTKTYSVYKNADTKVNFINVNDGSTVGQKTLKGHNGANSVLSAPTGYTLVNGADIYQTLNSDQPTKDIYVKPELDSENALSYTVTFRDKTDRSQVVGTEVKGTGSFGTYVGLTAPSGYAFASVLDNGFILLRNNQNVTKYVVAADTPYSISYVDQDTGKEVGTDVGKGADGSKIVLKAPTNYAFVSADDVNYTISSDTPTSTVYVQKSDQTEDNIVSGYPKNGYIKIYDEKGKLNNDVVLSEGSSWIIDKSLTINGAEYYRVATNEYVKASDVYKYTPLQTVATTNGKNLTPVYNSRGQVIIDRALDTNTPWYTDRSATIRGQKMYRVATDEWIKASDSTLR